MRLAICAYLAALLPFAAHAGASLVLSDGFVRSSNPKSGAAFMVIGNEGDSDCHLDAVQTGVAERAELHTHLDENGVTRMAAIKGGITIPAGQSHRLERGGDHVMLMGLHAPLTEGQAVPFTLDFGDCGTLTAELPVRNGNEAGQ